jgi:hypothetical protein
MAINVGILKFGQMSWQLEQSDIKTKTVLWFWFNVEAYLHGDECRCFGVQLKVTATWTELHEDTKSNLSSIKTRFHLFLKDISQWSCHKGGENWWRFYKTFLTRKLPIPRNDLDCCFFLAHFILFLSLRKGLYLTQLSSPKWVAAKLYW